MDASVTQWLELASSLGVTGLLVLVVRYLMSEKKDLIAKIDQRDERLLAKSEENATLGAEFKALAQSSLEAIKAMETAIANTCRHRPRDE